MWRARSDHRRPKSEVGRASSGRSASGSPARKAAATRSSSAWTSAPSRIPAAGSDAAVLGAAAAAAGSREDVPASSAAEQPDASTAASNRAVVVRTVHLGATTGTYGARPTAGCRLDEDHVDARLLTRLLACSRIGIGLALFAAPRTAARLWLGHEVSAGAGLLARGLGARDLALGVGQLVALDADRDVDPWMDAAIAADTADAAAALLARRDLDTRVVAGTTVAALGAAAAGLALKKALPTP